MSHQKRLPAHFLRMNEKDYIPPSKAVHLDFWSFKPAVWPLFRLIVRVGGIFQNNPEKYAIKKY